MNKKEITIGGKTFPVVFNMKTIMNYEEVTNGKSFFDEKFTTLKSRIALIISAALSADEKTTLTVEELTGNQDLKAVQEIINAQAVIMPLVTDFFDIPKIVEESDQPKEAEGEKGKN
ncbi:MAG: hypothetical protein IKK92_10635 [Prevotella sp.]|nr:hypothetical protein [Aeriscardovia sp.]MBR6606299.1 hypothetical protein [Prevotella sp.]